MPRQQSIPSRIFDADLIGRAAARLGAGRGRVGDTIDHGAGVLIHRAVGETVDAGAPVLELRCNEGHGLAAADALARAAIHIADVPPEPPPIIRGIVNPRL